MLGLLKWRILEALGGFWAPRDVEGVVSGPSTSIGQVALTNSQLAGHQQQQQGESRIDVDSNSTSAALRQPSPQFLEGPRKQYLNVCVRLYYAALNGDCESVKGILNENPEALNAAISDKRETVLHVAARANQVQLVKMLVNMQHIDMGLQDREGNTAFCFAVAGGASQVMEILMHKSADLVTTRGGKQMTPLYMAALFGHRAIALKLYPLTKRILQEKERKWTFFTCIHSGLYDLALAMLKDFPDLAVACDTQETALHVLARKPLEFATERGGILNQVLNFIPCMRFLISNKHKQSQALILAKELWKQVLLQKRNDKEIKRLIRQPTQLVIDAAEAGNYEFLVALICSYHDLLWEADEKRRTIFHIAVKNRHARIFRLIHEIGSIKDIILAFKDDEGNNILHLAAKYPPDIQANVVSGAALEMQHELLWFKEVEKIMQPSLRVTKNKNNETPQSKFSNDHKDLLEQGESWMKKTAESCTIVAALIATVVFAAAFTVPGGTSSDKGIPIHLKDNLYTIFSLSNAIAMFSSSTAILMFLSILTSRYAQRDFQRSLPCRLIIGLSCLFISMATMTIAFCMAFFIAYRAQSTWIPVLIAALQLVPVTLFLYLLFPLLRDIFSSTFLSHSLLNPSKRVLHWTGDDS